MIRNDLKRPPIIFVHTVADTPLARLRARTAHRDWETWDEEHPYEPHPRVSTEATAAWKAPVTDEATKTALTAYTGFAYGGINGILRDDDPAHASYYGKDSKEQGDLIHAAMRPMPDAATLYRSTNAEMFGMVSKTRLDPATGKAGAPDWQSIVGGTFTDKGFPSTSHDAENQGLASSVDVAIHVPAGTPALDMRPYAANPALDEHEVLLDKGLTFKVTKVDLPPEDKPYVHPVVHVDVVR